MLIIIKDIAMEFFLPNPLISTEKADIKTAGTCIIARIIIELKFYSADYILVFSNVKGTVNIIP